MFYTLRQLEVFLATAHYQNISKAAESLSMSQSAASGSLKEFESQFDIQLFDRVGKRLQLNSLGHSIRPQAESLLASAEALQQQLQDHRSHLGGGLNVGATLTIGNYLAVGLIADYKQRYPTASVALDIANTRDIARRVANYELDIGLIEGELNHPQLECHRWLDDELVPFCSPFHPLAKRRRLTERDILTADWILREQGSGTRQAFERGMQGLWPELNLVLELQHTEAIKRAVAADLGISCLSKLALQEAFDRGDLLPLKFKERQFKRNFYLIVHKDKYLTVDIERWFYLCGIERQG